MGSRQGRHRGDKTLLGAYVTHDVKALVVMTADRLGVTITDIILRGLFAEARRANLIDSNNQILPEHRAAFEAVRELCEVQRDERRRS